MVIRKVKNSVGNISVQIGFYEGHYFKLHKHIGSAKTEFELSLLLNKANQLISQNQICLFENKEPNIVDLSKFIPLGYLHSFAYSTLLDYVALIFSLQNDFFKNLVIIRIVSPGSKSESLKLLDQFFGIKYKKTTLFKSLLGFQKSEITKATVEFAVKYFGFDFAMVFYDVTTLYFETNKNDEFRKNGFSKDNKMHQPQVVIGLLVDLHGFPVDFEVFEGNKYEGSTILPVIQKFKTAHNVQTFTVVADAGMLSKNNLDELEKLGLFFIVAGRTATTPSEKLISIAKTLNNTDGKTVSRISGTRKTIFHYSAKRAQKDIFDLEKNIKKAEWVLNNPGKTFKKSKFVKNISTPKMHINLALIEKYRLLAGIKSYVTNLKDFSNLKVIERYKDLWKVEKAFRISKSDLEARPIFHRKQEMIRAHILIVFAALAVSKIIEYKSKQSIKEFVREIMQPIDCFFEDKVSGRKITFRIPPH
jgi:transposase